MRERQLFQHFCTSKLFIVIQLEIDSEAKNHRNTNTNLGKVCEMMSLCHNFHTEVGAVIRAQCIAEHLK